MGFRYSDWSYCRSSEARLAHKKEAICKIIDFEVPEDSRIEEKEKDKIKKYQNLGKEL